MLLQSTSLRSNSYACLDPREIRLCGWESTHSPQTNLFSPKPQTRLKTPKYLICHARIHTHCNFHMFTWRFCHKWMNKQISKRAKKSNKEHIIKCRWVVWRISDAVASSVVASHSSLFAKYQTSVGRVLVTGSMCRRRYTSFVNILAREVIGESNLEIDYQSRRHSTCHIQKMLTHAWLNNSVLIQGIRRLLGFGIPDEGRA